MLSFIVRVYEPADFDTLYAIDRACYPRGIAYSRRTLHSYLSPPHADCLVAQAKPRSRGEIMGFIIAVAGASEAHIITIDVAEPHRRSGVGTALLRAMEERLAMRGTRRIALETATSNEAGVAFWQRHGYRFAGVLRGYYLGRIDAYWMIKTLGENN
jgi:[ribosomal protein S18]-alanine N-acetyltransferase